MIEEEGTSGWECPVPKYNWSTNDFQNKWDKTLEYCDLIVEASEKTGLDPTLLAVLIYWESGGDSQAISSSGAVGLMQVMPRDGLAASFECINGPCFASRPTMEELEDPAFNIEYGSNILSGLLARTGSIREALFSYGPMDVGFEEYADKLLSLFERIKNQK